MQALLPLRGVIPKAARQLYKAQMHKQIQAAAGARNDESRLGAVAKATAQCFETVLVEARSEEVFIEDFHTKPCQMLSRFWPDLHTPP